MAKKGLYKGFSSFEFERTKNFALTDIELVKMDLLNHIFTKRGSRVMLPNFGSIIPDLVFEPLDDDTIETLQDELETIFRGDPRVEILSLSVTPNYDSYTVNVQAVLLYVELNMTDSFELNLQFEE